MFKFSQAVLRSIVLFTVLLPAAQADALALFTDVGSTRPTVEKPDANFVLRSRYIRLNKSVMDSLLKAMSFDTAGNPPNVHKIPKFAFNLFPNANYVIGEVTAMDGNILAGNLKDNSGFFQIVVSEDIFTAHISSYQSPQGEFEVSWVGNNLYKVIEINHSKLIDEPPGHQY